MSLPVVVGRAAPAITRAISAWIKRAPIKDISGFRSFIERHPITGTIIADAGIEGVLAIAEDESNPQQGDVLGALNQYASEHGISDIQESPSVFSSVKQEATDFLHNVQAGFGIGDDVGVASRPSRQSLQIDEGEAETMIASRDMAHFLKNEVSTSGVFIMRYHAMMRAFLDMDPQSLNHLIKVHF